VDFKLKNPLILFAIASLLAATPTHALPLAQCIREEMIQSFLEERGLNEASDQLVYGSYYSRKAIRTLIEKAQPSEHGFKHASTKTMKEAQQKSFQAAQYFPNVNHIAIERSVLRSSGGEWFTHSKATLYKLERLDQPIGFDQGEPTRWIRVELSGGIFHGHPISISRVRKYLKDAEP
jgi:tRNA(Ile)-lysidine synthase TilS/MesJ